MFNLKSKYKPTGDQPTAIRQLARGLKKGLKHQTLLGVTGSGKTFTIANVIAQHKKPTLVISHNKTLAAQLYQEFREFFPNNAVHYFVSYYDYYQPEAYIVHTDTYIEKDARINEEIDRLRHAATQALSSREDVIIVASVSCIYNLGSPEEYQKMAMNIFEHQEITTQDLVNSLRRLQYEESLELKRATYRKAGNEIEIVPSNGEYVIKVIIKNDKIASLKRAIIEDPENLFYASLKYERIIESKIFPAKYWLAPDAKIQIAAKNIRAEMQKHVKVLNKRGYILEAERLRERTERDLEMIRETGFCHGIENYSSHFEFREPGDPPYTLIDYFRHSGDFLTIIDESHLTTPQIRGMHSGDHSRKSTLVEHGFRLPSALDNRPLNFGEFEKKVGQTIYVSATPGPYELKKSKDNVAEQFIRPTGLLDPVIEIHPITDQVPHLLGEIKKETAKSNKVIVTTLTKRMAEDFTEYLLKNGVRANYIHSEIKTLQRIEIIHDLRSNKFDVIVGVNLLREGLDLPEVTLVAIFDADKEGFLRNATTLIQTMGRAARNKDGRVIMYADRITESMSKAIKETERRRAKQERYNTKHGITPTTIEKSLKKSDLHGLAQQDVKKDDIAKFFSLDPKDKVGLPKMTTKQKLKYLEREITRSVKKGHLERAMQLRDELLKIRHGN